MAIREIKIGGASLKALGLENAEWVTIRRAKGSGRPSIPHAATSDFLPTDPWSDYFMRTITDLRDEGVFDGQDVLELGAGDLRNLRILGKRIRSFRAVEIDPNRLNIGRVNLELDPVFSGVPHKLIPADAVEFLDRWKTEKPGNNFGGWALICLPQSPIGENSADMYNPNAQGLAPYKKWDKYGLTLNAAVLHKLRTVAALDLNVLIVNSHRVPSEIREGLIRSTGWSIADEYISPQIQQDPDTPVGWIAQSDIDDGRRFYEKTKSNLLRSISAVEAEARRVEAVVSGRGRDRFNVWHQLSFYRLRPELSTNGNLPR